MPSLSDAVAAIKRRPKRSAAIAIVGILAIAHFAPLLATYPSQDSCSFGPVSNARYRELLAEATRKPTTIWPSDLADTKKINALLNDRFDELSHGMTSIYERLAAMHAVVRSFGGEYRRTGVGSSNPYQYLIQRGGEVIGYDYYIDLNRHVFFSPFQRYLLLYGHLVLKDGASIVQDKRRSSLGDIEFHVRYPMIGFDDGRRIPRSPLGDVCPLLPDAALAARLSK